MNKPDAIYY